MKINIFTAILLLSATYSFAQVDVRHNLIESKVDTVYRKFEDFKIKTIVPENAVSINASYGIPFISNDLEKSEMWNKKSSIALNFGVDYKRQFMKTTIENNEVVQAPSSLGMGIGLGLSYLSQSSIMEDHTEMLNSFTDIDGDLCDVAFSYKGIKEKVSLTYLDIPLYLEIGKPNQAKINGYLNAGIKASVLVSGKFTGEGSYTSTGYYQNTNSTYHDIDVLNYYTNKASYENSEYKLSPFVLWGCLSGGVNIPFSNLEKNSVSKFILRVGAKVDYTILPVSKSVAEPYFKGAGYRISQSNILGETGSRILMLGVDIKLIYSFENRK